MFLKNCYRIKNAEFIGGYYEPDHERVFENLHEIYFEHLLFYNEAENQFLLVHNKWYFYGPYCQITRTVEPISGKELADFISEKSMYDSWSSYLVDIMYDTMLDEDHIYFWDDVLNLGSITIE